MGTEPNTNLVEVGTAGEQSAAPTPLKAKIHVHFRRHNSWIDYMMERNNDDAMRYGFDWLGDEEFDFGKRTSKTPIAPQKSRYDYLEKVNTHPNTAITVQTEVLSPDLCNLEKQTTRVRAAGSTIPIAPDTATANSTNTTTDSAEGASSTGSTITLTKKNARLLTKSATEKVRIQDENEKIVGRAPTGSTDNLALCITELEKQYKVKSIHSEKYYSSFLNVRYNHEVKLKIGFRDLQVAPLPLFGNNNDEIHLIAEKEGTVDYNTYFTITPNILKKADFAATGEVIVTIKNITKSLPKDVRIIAYHIDDNTPKNTSTGKPIIRIDGNLSGQMFVLKNKNYFEQKCYIVKVIRNIPSAPITAGTTGGSTPATTPTDFSTNGGWSVYDINRIKMILKRTMNQALIETIIDDTLTISTANTIVNNDDPNADRELQTFLSSQPASVGLTANSKHIFIFLHDYALTNNILGFGQLETHPSKKKQLWQSLLDFQQSE